MNADKLRAILNKRPDLVDVERETAAPPPTGTDEFETDSATWAEHARKETVPMKGVDKKKGLSSEEIQQAFAPRELGTGKGATAPDAANEDLARAYMAAGERLLADLGTARTAKPESRSAIRRVVKKPRNGELAGDTETGGPTGKDLLIDENEGIIGSQG